LLTCSEIAAEDGVAESGVDLAMEGHGGIAVDGDDGNDAGRGLDHDLPW